MIKFKKGDKVRYIEHIVPENALNCGRCERFKIGRTFIIKDIKNKDTGLEGHTLYWVGVDEAYFDFRLELVESKKKLTFKDFAEKI